MEELTYTDLEPPASVTPDYEQTAAKQVYTPEALNDSHIDCGQRVTSYANPNVTNRTLVNVTSENVDSVFEQINNEHSVYSGASEKVNHVVKLFRDLPKDLFIGRIMSDHNSEETKLKELRNHIFTEIKNLEDFPFSLAAELKRRKQTKYGDSTALKLSGDIYTLISVFEGAPYEDLKELFSVSKSSSEVFNQSLLASNSGTESKATACKCEADLALFRGLLANVQSELKSLKEENELLKSNFQEQIDSIKTDFESLNSDISESVEELQTTASSCRQLMTNMNDENSNGVASIKNDVKQIRTELKSLYDHVELKNWELNNKMSNNKTLEKRLVKVENSLHATRKCVTPNSPPIEATIDSASSGVAPSHTSNPESDGNNSRTMNASFLAEKLPVSGAVTNVTISGPSNSVLTRDPDTGLFKRQPVDMCTPRAWSIPISAPSSNQDVQAHVPPHTTSYGHNSANRTLEKSNQGSVTSNDTSTTQSYGAYDTAKTQSYGTYTQPDTYDNNTNWNGTNDNGDTNNEQDSNMMHYQCSVENRYSALQSGHNKTVVPGISAFSDVLRNTSAYDRLNIPVHVSNTSDRQKKNRTKPQSYYTKMCTSEQNGINTSSVNTTETQNIDPDDDFIQYVRRKPVRYYIGGFKSTISEQKLANYLLRRGITVSRINIRRYEDQDRSVIQLNVDPEHGPSLQQRGFWPPGVYCRQWYTRNEYRQKTFGDNFPN